MTRPDEFSSAIPTQAPPELESLIAASEPAMNSLLKRSLAFPSLSGNEAPFAQFIADWSRQQGFAVDLWETEEASLQWPSSSASGPQALPRHIPLKGRPTLCITHEGSDAARSLIFNAHSDVVAAPGPQRWRFDPWSGSEHLGRVYGRGACDTKGPLVAALWAMSCVRQLSRPGLGRVLLELVPGEEDCVGLGTLTSAARGYRADAAIVLEPTGNIPRCASRGGCRFDITCTGRSVHGTVKWLGDDAIARLRHVLAALETVERDWNRSTPDPLFAPYPIVRPITVDRVHGGDWQGMTCDHCECSGYLELLPGDSLEEWKHRLADAMREALQQQGEDASKTTVRFSEAYGGHRTAPAEAICLAADRVLNRVAGRWSAFNSGCEAGLRWQLYGTPTLVWGPGDLAQAHCIDEFVDWADIRTAAILFARLILDWCRQYPQAASPSPR